MCAEEKIRFFARPAGLTFEYPMEKALGELFTSMLSNNGTRQRCESNTQLIGVNGAQCLFACRQFAAENFFRESDPTALGWNITVAAISPILASGGTPICCAQVLRVGADWNTHYVRQFAAGVRQVLNLAHARFVGGDCERSEHWSCTVSEIGLCEGRPILRHGAKPGDLIYISGEIGAGNLEAALRLNGEATSGSIDNRFALRLREAAIMRNCASSCIDTSCGVWNSLNTLADLNKCGYSVDSLPYLPSALHFCQKLSLPQQLLFLGECGEYELLFTMRPAHEKSFLTQARQFGCDFHRLGRIVSCGKTLQENGREIDLESLCYHAREYPTGKQHLAALRCWLRKRHRLNRLNVLKPTLE